MKAERTASPPSPADWWSADVPRSEIVKLLKKRDAPGLWLLLVWFAALAVTTWGLAALWGSLWAIPMLVVHGAVLSFAYAASHEGAHGTAFKTKWLNEAMFYLTSFVFMEEPMNRRYSHGRHHAHTWYHEFDSQMPYRNPLTLRTYLSETFGFKAFIDVWPQLWRFARGKLTDTQLEFIPANKIAQLKWGARGFLLGYAGIVAASVIAGSWFPVVAFFGARLAGGWIVHMLINSQHMCMEENVPDHRFTTRSLRCWALTRALYWNMNYHIEHHLYPGVPFHALKGVNRLIGPQLPQPSAGFVRANLDILRVIRRQTRDPAHTSRPQFSSQPSL